MRKLWCLAWGSLLLCHCGGESGSSSMPPNGGDAGTAGSMPSAGQAQGGSAGSGSGGTGNATAGKSNGGATSMAGSGGKATGGGGNMSVAGSGGSGGAAQCPAGPPADKGSGACHDFTPCGGDVVGKWKVDACLDPALSGLRTFCPEAVETISLTGTADIRADGTMSSTLKVVSHTVLPASCVAALGACGQTTQGVNLLADCTPGANGSCDCADETDSAPTDATYLTKGNVWTVQRDDCPSYSYYCRQGDELWLRGADPNNGRISVLHLTKQ